MRTTLCSLLEWEARRSATIILLFFPARSPRPDTLMLPMIVCSLLINCHSLAVQLWLERRISEPKTLKPAFGGIRIAVCRGWRGPWNANYNIVKINICIILSYLSLCICVFYLKPYLTISKQYDLNSTHRVWLCNACIRISFVETHVEFFF